MIHKGTKLALSGYYTNPRLGVTFTAYTPCAAVVKTHRGVHRACVLGARKTLTIRHAGVFRQFPAGLLLRVPER